MPVTRLEMKERVSLDRAPIEDMVRVLGVERAETLVGGAMEEMAVWMARAEKLWRTGKIEELGRLAARVAPVAERLGMPLLGRVAREVVEQTQGTDQAALGATTLRMVRVGEGSLVAIWDLQDTIG